MDLFPTTSLPIHAISSTITFKTLLKRLFINNFSLVFFALLICTTLFLSSFVLDHDFCVYSVIWLTFVFALLVGHTCLNLAKIKKNLHENQPY